VTYRTHPVYRFTALFLATILLILGRQLLTQQGWLGIIIFCFLLTFTAYSIWLATTYIVLNADRIQVRRPFLPPQIVPFRGLSRVREVHRTRQPYIYLYCEEVDGSTSHPGQDVLRLPRIAFQKQLLAELVARVPVQT
jgi:hypothetical protein